MICVACGAVRELQLDTAVVRLRRMASQDHFSIDNITLEVIGQCKACHNSGADRLTGRSSIILVGSDNALVSVDGAGL